MTSRGAKYWSTGAIPLIAPDLLGSIISSASDIAVVIDDMGQILSVLVNPQQGGIGPFDDWQGQDIREVLTTESIAKLEKRLDEFARGITREAPLELNHRASSGLKFPIRYSFHRVGPDGAIILLGRDLRPIAEMQQQLVDAQLALERDYEANREIATRMRVLMDLTRDAIVFVSLSSGRISGLNTAAAVALGAKVADLKGTPLSDALRSDTGASALDVLSAAGRSEDSAGVRLTATGSGVELVLHITLFRAAGERMLACRLDQIEDGTQSENVLGDALMQLHDHMADGMVFTDRAGIIASVNDGFLDLVDLDSAGMARGRSLADFLARGAVDLKVMCENAVRNGQIRLYPAKLSTDVGTELATEISVTYLSDSPKAAFGFVIRDASRQDSGRAATHPGMEDESMRAIRELVGTASLKELVGETSDVIEKMCIETAVELTGNNRVAAAEMLGLSRQSLYVKLRKHGLLARSED
ncbi:transcriptional regulator PpsR [Maribius pontilimi]|uniref:Transcriptional regulator PpsR n=1 Tax=Palleronia pontilimi TaxID=1964209 RepID=A0A934IHK6_9RHOB|nr:transcriptional regulator PpsR [Palleronia pontilimi]MBJ3763212.1 transcriptional regulator PpsR [Palleronia pontilimi]